MLKIGGSDLSGVRVDMSGLYQICPVWGLNMSHPTG
jgi:hypothetical protein